MRLFVSLDSYYFVLFLWNSTFFLLECLSTNVFNMDVNMKKSRGKDFARKTRNDRFRDKKKTSHSKTLAPTNTISERISKESKSESNSSSSDSENGDTDIRKYGRSKIVSNESFYDEHLPDPNSEPPLASFEELAASGDVKGGIFHFKDEADWASCSANIKSQYFHLDLKQLSKSLASIPFYERVDLSENLYTLDEKLKMDQEAEKNYLIYTKSLSSAQNMKGLDQILTSIKNQQSMEAKSGSHSVECDDDNVSALTTQFKSIPSDLTDLLTSRTPQVVATAKEVALVEEVPEEKPKIPAQEGVEELTEWLDSILDD